MLSKTVYAVQPYQVGNKNKKSLVIVIPANVTKECGITTSTIFAIHVDSKRRNIMLNMLNMLNNENEEKNGLDVPGEETVQVPDHQVRLQPQ